MGSCARCNRRDLPANPEVGNIYTGVVSKIMEFGAFVTLEGLRERIDGLVHISQLADSRVNRTEDVVQRGDRVKVKVLKQEGHRTSLSMKEVEQSTGEDLKPAGGGPKPFATGANAIATGQNPDKPKALPKTGFEAMNIPALDDNEKSARGSKRLTSPEKFELKQLVRCLCVNWCRVWQMVPSGRVVCASAWRSLHGSTPCEWSRVVITSGVCAACSMTL